MILTTQGIVKGRQIKLDRALGLPEGARVQLKIEVQPKTRSAKRRLAAELFGSCADDPTFGAAVAAIEQQRRLRPPRKVAFGVAA